MSATHTCFYLHTADTVAPKQRATPKMVPLVAEKEVEAKEVEAKDDE